MKKIQLISVTILLFVLVGCGEKEYPFNIGNADNIVVFYGSSSHAMISDDKDTIKSVVNCFKNLSFERSNEQIDIFTLISVYFNEGDKQIAQVHVDKNDVFWIDGSAECYKISSGFFNYNSVKEIYEASKEQ